MINSDVIYILSSHYSVGKSILTCDELDPIKPDEIKDNKPVSIFSIARKYKLDQIFLVDSNFSGFIEAYKSAEKAKTQLIFGLKLVTCDNIEDKSDSSFNSESKIIIWLKNSKAYSDAIKIYSKAATDGFYYLPRISWKFLKEMWTENLSLTIPFYSGFLHNNLLKNGKVVPDFPMKPKFHYSSQDLPFDYLIQNTIDNYCKINKLEKINSHQVYCYKNSDSLALQTFRLITSRSENSKSSIQKPNIDNFGSKSFSFESYLNKIGKTIDA